MSHKTPLVSRPPRAFRQQAMIVFQVQLTKRQGIVPMTRDYIGREEARLRALESGGRPPELESEHRRLLVKRLLSKFRLLFPCGGYWGNRPQSVTSSRARV